MPPHISKMAVCIRVSPKLMTDAQADWGLSLIDCTSGAQWAVRAKLAPIKKVMLHERTDQSWWPLAVCIRFICDSERRVTDSSAWEEVTLTRMDWMSPQQRGAKTTNGNGVNGYTLAAKPVLCFATNVERAADYTVGSPTICPRTQ